MNLLLRAAVLTSWLMVIMPATVPAQESPHGPLTIACTDCHTTEDWTVLKSPVAFDHSSTSFPLNGQHQRVACRDCHTNLRFAGTPTACASCHLGDYQSALSINHRAAGFSTQCEDCHRESALSWQASFDHDRTQFPTRGIHATVACAACHANNRYRGTPVECVACHSRDYYASTSPNHLTAGFSTDCAVCHRALTWQPATFFPHPYFPIGNGDRHHPGVWNTCADCHAEQPTYAKFECINCHEHSKTRTDARHEEVPGYAYESTSCYRCHPSP